MSAIRTVRIERNHAMNFLSKLFGRHPQPATVQQPTPDELQPEPENYVVGYVSEEGKRRSLSPAPLLMYGHMARVSARRTAADTTISCMAVAGLDTLEQTIAKLPSIGLCAMSRVDHLGEAAEAIKIYRRLSAQRGLTIYGAWDYNVERAARRAITCGADGIQMPGIYTSELYAYLLGLLGEVQNGAPVPTTVEEHVARLRRYTTDKSKFWEIQDLVHSKYY